MIYEILKVGKDNATKSKEICQRLRIDERTLRRLVENERKEGKMICNCSKGYYIPETLEELEHTRNYFKSLENSNRETVKLFDRLIDEWKRAAEPGPGRQMTIEDYLKGDDRK